MKTVVKNIIVLFLLALFLLFGIFFAEKALAPQNGAFNGFYEEEQDTIDVIFIGGSHGMAAFNPAQLWLEEGFTSYNMYSWSQNAWTAYHYAIEAINHQNPKVIVVEAFSFAYGASYLPAQTSDETSNEFALSIPPSFNRLMLSLAIRQNQYIPLPMSKMVPFFRYHSRWADITAQEVYDNLFVSDYSSNKGFGPIYTTEPYDSFSFEALGTASVLHENSEKYLLKLIELTDEKGIDLIVAKTPYIALDEDGGYMARIEQICDENDVEFVNYMSEQLLLETGFDYASDMAEHAHINYKGAQKLTQHMGALIAQNYLQQPVYDESTAERWQADAQKEMRDIENIDITLSEDFEHLATLLSEREGYIAIITAHGNLSGEDLAPMEKGLEMMGIDADDVSADNLNKTYIYAQNTLQDAEFLQQSGFDVEVSVSADASSIVVDGEEYSRNREGFNVVLLDGVTKEVLQGVSFAVEHGFTPFTA